MQSDLPKKPFVQSISGILFRSLFAAWIKLVPAIGRYVKQGDGGDG
jgi:hypothetical protein